MLLMMYVARVHYALRQTADSDVVGYSTCLGILVLVLVPSHL